MEIGPVGYSQGTGASFTSTTNSATATGLSPNTYYDAYVQSNCTATGDGYSTWAGPFTFKTECASFAAAKDAHSVLKVNGPAQVEYPSPVAVQFD